MAVLLFAASVGAALLTIGDVGQPQLSVTPDRAAVSTVAVGSHAWIMGARPGMPATPWPDGSGYELVVDGVVVGVPVRAPLTVDALLLLVLATAAAGAVLRSIGLPGSTATLAAAAGIALLPAYDAHGLPLSYLLAPIPIVIGWTALPPGLGLLKSATLGAMLGVLFVANVIGDVSWLVVWLAPLVLGTVTPVLGAAMAARRLASGGRFRLRDVVRFTTPLDRRARLTAVETERDRLASELHNVVLPRLNTTIAGLDPAADADGVGGDLRQLGNDLRDMMMDRQTVVLRSGGLVAAVDALVEALPSWPPVVTRSSDEGRPPDHVELAAYRVVQSAIDNARRHADATTIWVTLAVSPRRVDVDVRDDGRGLLALGVRRHIGTGVLEMHARADEVGARLVIEPDASGGVRVAFRWTT